MHRHSCTAGRRQGLECTQILAPWVDFMKGSCMLHMQGSCPAAPPTHASIWPAPAPPARAARPQRPRSCCCAMAQVSAHRGPAVPATVSSFTAAPPVGSGHSRAYFSSALQSRWQEPPGWRPANKTAGQLCSMCSPDLPAHPGCLAASPMHCHRLPFIFSLAHHPGTWLPVAAGGPQPAQVPSIPLWPPPADGAAPSQQQMPPAAAAASQLPVLTRHSSCPPPVPPLQMVEDAATNESPYIGGKDVCAWDCAMAPRLYLARQGCKLLKVGWVGAWVVVLVGGCSPAPWP